MGWPSFVGVTRDFWTATSPDTRRSPPSLSGNVQRVTPLDAHFRADVTVLITPEDRDQWNAFLAGRRGALRTFSCGPQLVATNLDDTVTALSAAASAGDIQLSFNCADSALVPAYAVLGIGGRLYYSHGVSINSGTNATVDIWPPLRADLSGGTSPDSTPETTVYIESHEPAGWSADGSASLVSVQLREAAS